MAASNRFLARNRENADFNQYWYSRNTIAAIVDEVQNESKSGKAAFISTPSIYFSLTSDLHQQNSKVFDIDRKWESLNGFVFFDFTFPENIPEDLHHSFDICVIDPPFITRDVWEKYALAARLLLVEGKSDDGVPLGKIILSTIAENATLVKELLDVEPCTFKPSIPNLVYQYLLYTNYPTSGLFSTVNAEIPEE